MADLKQERRIRQEWENASPEEKRNPLLFINRIVYRSDWFRSTAEDAHTMAKRVIKLSPFAE